MTAVQETADRILEATVVGSFSRIGYEARRRMFGWPEPADVAGVEALVTGATSGLGLETATWLARLGARVTFIARDGERSEKARRSIAEQSGRQDVSYLLADLSDQQAVRRAAAEYLDRHDRLDVLVHNAGMLTHDYQTAPDGTELTVATHVLGPFLLTGLLLPALRQSRPDAGPGRVLTVSSGGMYSQKFDLARLDSSPDGFDGTKAYARAKRAQVVLTHEWARRVDPAAVVFHAMHPGWADTPGVRSSLPGFHRVTGPVLRSPHQGVDTLVWLAGTPEAARTSGKFWLDRRTRSEYKLPWTRPSDPAGDQSRLWEWCATRTGWDLPAGGAG